MHQIPHTETTESHDLKAYNYEHNISLCHTLQDMTDHGSPQVLNFFR